MGRNVLYLAGSEVAFTDKFIHAKKALGVKDAVQRWVNRC